MKAIAMDEQEWRLIAEAPDGVDTLRRRFPA